MSVLYLNSPPQTVMDGVFPELSCRKLKRSWLQKPAWHSN